MTINSNSDTLAIVADVFSLYKVTEESFNPFSYGGFNLNDWNFLTDALLTKLSISYPLENSAYTDFTESHTFTIPVGNISVKEAKNKLEESVALYKKEHKEISHTSFFIDVNPDYINKWFKEIVKLEIYSCIQTILINYIDNNAIHFNYAEYGSIYKFIFENRRALYRIRPEIKTTVKYYINYLYGALRADKSIIRSTINNGRIIADFNKFTNRIFNDFKHYVIAVDGDVIYLRNCEGVMNDIINVLNSKYTFETNIENGYSGMFLGRKKCILVKDNNVKLTGIKSL